MVDPSQHGFRLRAWIGEPPCKGKRLRLSPLGWEGLGLLLFIFILFLIMFFLLEGRGAWPVFFFIYVCWRGGAWPFIVYCFIFIFVGGGEGGGTCYQADPKLSQDPELGKQLATIEASMKQAGPT